MSQLTLKRVKQEDIQHDKLYVIYEMRTIRNGNATFKSYRNPMIFRGYREMTLGSDAAIYELPSTPDPKGKDDE